MSGPSVARPTTLDAALAMRSERPDALVLAGGTDLMVQLGDAPAPAQILDLWACSELRRIGRLSDAAGRAWWQIGAMTTWTDLARHGTMLPVLRECARTIGARQIQNRGTVGGNIMNASPAGDSLPLWLALDAQFEVASARGLRRLPAADFFVGYRKVDLAPDELLVAVHVPDPGTDHLAYRKVGTRLAQSISKVVLGGRVRVEDGVVVEARIALGSVAPTPVRCAAVEAALLGAPVDPGAAAWVGRDIQPIDDIRSTAAYRLQVAENIVRRWLSRLVG